MGPGGLNFLQLVTNPDLETGILQTRNGYSCLGQYPWKRRYLLPVGEWVPGTHKWDFGKIQPCGVCGLGNDGPRHACLHCKGATMVEVQADMQESFYEMLPCFAEAMVEATRKNTTVKDYAKIMATLEKALKSLIEDCDEKNIPDWIIYRMLLVAPFPEFIAEGPCHLGAIFDNVRILRRWASKPANIITRWAAKWIDVISETRLRALPQGYYPVVKKSEKNKK